MALEQREQVTLRARQFYPGDTILMQARALTDAQVRQHILAYHLDDRLLVEQAQAMG